MLSLGVVLYERVTGAAGHAPTNSDLLVAIPSATRRLFERGARLTLQLE